MVSRTREYFLFFSGIIIHALSCWSSGFLVHGYVSPSPSSRSNRLSDSYDVVVVGSGIGGLSAAAMLGKYGYKVCVLESHYLPGGAAHGFEMKDKENRVFRFDTGPSFFSGLNPDIPAKASNPMRTVLDAIDERVECIPYDSFGLHFPEGNFIHTTNFVNEVISKVSGSEGSKQWQRLMRDMKPLEAAVAAMPTAALRFDPGVVLSAGQFMPNFAFIEGGPFTTSKLTTAFESILKQSGVKDPFVKNWVDLLCFCLSGLPAQGTITAEMAMMMGEFYEPGALMDCPIGGARSIVEALIRGIEKYGGSVILNSHVDEIIIEEGRATGVRLKGSSGKCINANKGVISNLSVWDLFGSGIIEKKAFPEKFVKERLETPVGKSFMHLHVAFKATKEELENLQAHYMYIDDWNRGVEAEDNAGLISIPSVHDETLAPEGFGVLHIYTPATENFERWKGLDRNSSEYLHLKQERSEYLWKVLDKVVPINIRERAHIFKTGTPLTHQRFLRRYNGSYGPAIRAPDQSFPFPTTPVKNLLLCGDSCFPGIGVPAVAGSGILAANSVSLESLGPQLKLLEVLKGL